MGSKDEQYSQSSNRNREYRSDIQMNLGTVFGQKSVGCALIFQDYKITVQS